MDMREWIDGFVLRNTTLFARLHAMQRARKLLRHRVGVG